MSVDLYTDTNSYYVPEWHESMSRKKFATAQFELNLLRRAAVYYDKSSYAPRLQ
jgi:hypothetical protein